MYYVHIYISHSLAYKPLFDHPLGFVLHTHTVWVIPGVLKSMVVPLSDMFVALAFSLVRQTEEQGYNNSISPSEQYNNYAKDMGH